MIRWFNGLKVAQKLALISVVFMIPDSVMLYLFITSINENIQFAKLEQTGNEYQRPLERLLDLIPQHRMLARSTAGDAAADLLTAKQQEIDNAFDGLQAVDARIGRTLDFTADGLAKHNRQGCDYADVRHEWDAIKKQCGNGGADLDQNHLKLIADASSKL